jgi:hypothetical protein
LSRETIRTLNSEVRQHQDMERLGAGSRSERVQTLADSAF